MSRYTLGEIAVWLVLAAVLGFVLGWLSREIVLRSRRGRSTDLAVQVETAPVAAEPSPGRSEPSPRPSEEPAPAPVPDVGAEPHDGPDVEPGKHPGSAKPLEGGAPPAERFTVKGNEKSMIYHAPGSPSYQRTTAQTWFESEDAALAAGFRKPKNA